MHIDELLPPLKKIPTFIEMYNKPLSDFLEVQIIRATVRPAIGEEQYNIDNETDHVADRKLEIPETDECIDILSLILNCVQSALSFVKDPENDSQRTTERIKMVLNLFRESGIKGMS